jgi:hypothetical protein
MTFCSSFDNFISLFAIEQSSAEDVLAVGMLVADVLVLVYDCTPYKYCIIFLTLETVVASFLLNSIKTYLLPHFL